MSVVSARADGGMPKGKAAYERSKQRGTEKIDPLTKAITHRGILSSILPQSYFSPASLLPRRLQIVGDRECVLASHRDILQVKWATIEQEKAEELTVNAGGCMGKDLEIESVSTLTRKGKTTTNIGGEGQDLFGAEIQSLSTVEVNGALLMAASDAVGNCVVYNLSKSNSSREGTHTSPQMKRRKLPGERYATSDIASDSEETSDSSRFHKVQGKVWSEGGFVEARFDPVTSNQMLISSFFGQEVRVVDYSEGKLIRRLGAALPVTQCGYFSSATSEHMPKKNGSMEKASDSLGTVEQGANASVGSTGAPFAASSSLIVCAEYNEISVWDVRQSERGGLVARVRPSALTSSLYTICCFPEKQTIVAAGEEKSLLIMETRKWRQRGREKLPLGHSCVSLLRSPRSSFLYAVGADRELVAVNYSSLLREGKTTDNQKQIKQKGNGREDASKKWSESKGADFEHMNKGLRADARWIGVALGATSSGAEKDAHEDKVKDRATYDQVVAASETGSLYVVRKAELLAC